MKRYIFAVMVVSLLSSIICTANADVDFSGMNLDELIGAQKKLTDAMWASEDWESVVVPVGVYEVGVDIPSGKWTISGTEGKSGIIYWGESLDRYGVEIEDKIAEFTHWKDEGISWNLIDGTYISVTISPVIFTPYIPATLGFGKKSQKQDENVSGDPLLEQNEKLTARVSELEEQNKALQGRIEELQAQLETREAETDVSITVEETPKPTENVGAMRELKFTDTGADEKRVNQRLSDLGFLSGTVLQYYGSITKDAVERFQKCVGLPVTGIADEKTQNILFSSTVTAPPTPSPTPWFEPSTHVESTKSPAYSRLQKGSKGEEVEKLQKRLKELGYLSGSADGDYGNMTESAVKAFQESAGLSQTGVADSKTQDKLYSNNAPRAKIYEKLDYTAVARDPYAYKGDLITFQGKILQVMENGKDVVFRISSKGNYDNVVYCTYTAPSYYSRFLEDDRVTVYGVCTGVYTYETVMGASVTIPSCRIDRIELR